MSKKIPWKKLHTMQCACCHKVTASEQFFVNMCADTSPLKGTWQPVCFHCDLALNFAVLKFFHGHDKAEELVETYRQRSLL